MASTKKFWRGLEELNQNSSLTEEMMTKEFAQEVPVDQVDEPSKAFDSKTTRRDFLKFVGFSTAAATLAACESPVIKSVPYVVKPEEVTPGMANYYATTFMDGFDFSSVLVKTREGRPIKVSPNNASKYFGCANARVQASVLSLYDNSRYKAPSIKGAVSSWDKVDATVIKALKDAQAAGQKVRLITPSLPSPSAQKLIQEFSAKYNAEAVVFDAVSYNDALDAYEETLGYRAFPYHDFSKAKLTVSFGANFLEDWLGGGYESSYTESRKAGKDMGRHIQVESNLTLSGANSDKRYPVKPSQGAKILAAVYGILSGTAVSVPAPLSKVAKSIAAELKDAGSNALVVADGSKEVYQIALAINTLLGSVAVDTSKKVLLKSSNQKQWNQFVADAKSGTVAVALFLNVDPVFNGNLTEADFKKIKTSVALVNTSSNQTSKLASIIAPVNHYLESWGDANPITGLYTLMQPTIQPLFKTRQFEDSLLTWMAAPSTVITTDEEGNEVVSESKQVEENYYSYLKNNWKANVLTAANTDWNTALHDGSVSTSEVATATASMAAVSMAVSKVISKKENAFELTLYTKTGLGDGGQYNNAWLHELPDPITRTSWDNYVTMSLVDANEFGFKNENQSDGSINGNYVDVKIGKTVVTAPVYIQPGQAKGSIGLAVGYGRTGKIAEANDLEVIGVNAYPLLQNASKVQDVVLEKSSNTEEHEFACMQLQHTLMGRDDEILKHVELDEYLNGDPHKWNHRHEFATHKGKKTADKLDLWTAHDTSVGHFFNLSIDLNLCTGCAACVIACQAENNTPVVGKEEIRKSRDMYWLRIDRYYTSEVTKASANAEGLSETINMYLDMEIPSENPEVYFQPMMCQHCNHASCETVCPVAATSHGKEGQNQMAYNRCVGTRYCLNNCPYKVRRFNWFKYSSSARFQFNMYDDLGKMVLNPDVAVRSRGVMEKCSFCIQSTQAAKLKAKREGRKVRDEEFRAACGEACGTGAMTFGDINDEESLVFEKSKDVRKYHVLDALGMRPNVFYHTKVENKKGLTNHA